MGLRFVHRSAVICLFFKLGFCAFLGAAHFASLSVYFLLVPLALCSFSQRSFQKSFACSLCFVYGLCLRSRFLLLVLRFLVCCSFCIVCFLNVVFQFVVFSFRAWRKVFYMRAFSSTSFLDCFFAFDFYFLGLFFVRVESLVLLCQIGRAFVEC